MLEGCKNAMQCRLQNGFMRHRLNENRRQTPCIQALGHVHGSGFFPTHRFCDLVIEMQALA